MSKKSGAGRVILTVLLAVVLCVSLLASTVLTVIRGTLSVDNLMKLLESVDISSLDLDSLGSAIPGLAKNQSADGAARARVTTLAAAPGTLTAAAVAESSGDGETEDGDSEADANSFLTDKILEALQGQVGTGSDIPADIDREQLEHLMEQDFVKDFIEDVTEDYKDAIFSTEELPEDAGLSAGKVTDFLKKNEQAINEALTDAGFTGTITIDEESLRRELETSLDDVVPTPAQVRQEIEANFSEQLNTIRAVFSDLPFYVAWAVTAVLAVLLLLVNLKRLSGALLGAGIPAILVGAVLLALGPVISSMAAENASLASTVDVLLAPLRSTGTVTAGAGLGLTVLGVLAALLGRRRA